MNHKDEVELIRKRAFQNLKASKLVFHEKYFDLAIFLAEQALQLYLKSIILEETGEMPRTHSIRQLIGIIRGIKVNISKDVDNFVRNNREKLSLLEDAYIASRYLKRIYDKDEAEKMIEFVEEAISFWRSILRL